MSDAAPIALFVYNRPEHTRRTVEALSRNSGANDSVLHIYSDAPRTDDDAASVQKVRTYIKGITGFKQVVIKEQEQNLGLAMSIIGGVSALCEEYGRAIVLEDDLETSPHFLNFMNDALNYYADAAEVMHISGFRYPVDQFESDDTFFLHVPLCWGWATWQRAWRSFSNDISVMGRFDRQRIRQFDFGDSYAFWRQLELNKSGALKTWFIFWYATLYLRGGLSLFPSRSLVQNIGMDNSGTHSSTSNDYRVVLSDTPIQVTRIPLVESTTGYEFHQRYFRRLKGGVLKRLVRKFKRLLSISS